MKHSKTLTLFCSILCLCTVGLVRAQVPTSVLPDFQNSFNLPGGIQNPPATVSNFAVSFNGHVGPYSPPSGGGPEQVPAGSTYSIQDSSFGVYLSRASPDVNGTIDNTIAETLPLLYYPLADPPDQGIAAFRYKVLLYGHDPGGGVRANFEDIATLYGNDERVRGLQAEDALLDVLSLNPLYAPLHDAILDLFYDRSAAEMQFVKQKLGEMSEYRLGLQAVPPGSFAISEEIRIYGEIIPIYEAILADYARLFNGGFGVNIGDYADVPSGTTAGYFLFQQRTPARALMAANFVDTEDNDTIKPVPDVEVNPENGQIISQNNDPRALFNGYKDYVLLLQVLRDYVKQSGEHAKALALRNSPGDRDAAYAIIEKVQHEAFVNNLILEGMFPDYTPEPDDPAGVNAARSSLATSMGDLNDVKAILDGEVNPLGYDPDFLVLIQEFPTGIPQTPFLFDSYDALVEWIRFTSASPLNFAEMTFDEAVSSFFQYKGFADQVFNEIDNAEDTYTLEYFDIVGADPGDPVFDLNNPAPGSELDLVDQRITAQSDRMSQLSLVAKQIMSEIENATDLRDNVIPGKEQGINGAVADYKGKAGSQWDKIRNWNAAQAAAQAAYDTISDIAGQSTVDILLGKGVVAGAAIGVAGAANTAVQTIGEVQKGNAMKQLDFLSADLDADMALTDIPLLESEAEQLIRGLTRDLISLAVDSIEAQAILAQEVAARAQLIRRIQRQLAFLEETQSEVADRFYADPIHYVRSQNRMIKADNAFRRAQMWVFFTLRALEYKFNKPFQSQDQTMDSSTLFKLRNFEELELFVAAMEDFNLFNLIGFNREFNVDRLSLREHFMGYPDLNSEGQPAMYLDPDTGELLTPIEAFRLVLRDKIDAQGNLVLRFNSFAINKPDGSFFVGPVYSLPQGPSNDIDIVSAGKYLDKIDWIKVNMVGSHTPKEVAGGVLTYGGNTYLRNRVPPTKTFDDIRELSGEYRIYPFRFFFTLDNGATFESRASQQDTIKLVFTNATGEPEQGVPNADSENRFLKERGVAATSWELTILAPHVDIDNLDDIELWMRHQFVSRFNPDSN